MAKRSSLNGIPHNITQSLIGTERYWICGYMADWIFNAAKRVNANEVILDVWNVNIQPQKLALLQLTTALKDLRQIICKELKNNGFPDDFIIDAKIIITFPELGTKWMALHPQMTDRDGRLYKCEKILGQAMEADFDPFIIPQPDNVIEGSFFFLKNRSAND